MAERRWQFPRGVLVRYAQKSRVEGACCHRASMPVNRVLRCSKIGLLYRSGGNGFALVGKIMQRPKPMVGNSKKNGRVLFYVGYLEGHIVLKPATSDDEAPPLGGLWGQVFPDP
jgi:hypothetical protein